jgi:intein/homing endonuclease
MARRNRRLIKKNLSIIGNNARAKMRLLGIVHGDGNTSYNRLLITDMSKEFHETVIIPTVMRVFGVKMNLFHDVNRNSYYSHTKKKAVYGFFTSELEVPKGAIRDKLYIPNFLKEANPTLQRAYVGGLYDAEGCVKSRQAEINFSTTSKEIYGFVGKVLKSAKIQFSTYERSRRAKREYEFYIYGTDDLKRFDELIKFTHPWKIRKLRKYI